VHAALLPLAEVARAYNAVELQRHGNKENRTLKVTRFYTGDDDRSHFEDLEISWDDPTRGLRTSPISVNGLMFRASEGDAHFLELHPAPRRQLILCMAGVVEIELGDGEKRRFGPGDVYFADDLTGEGHRHREISGPLLHAWVFLPEDFDPAPWRA
jgi:hypothetical protein